jgi:hypothetical protein
MVKKWQASFFIECPRMHLDLTPEEEKKEAEGYGSQDLKLSTRFRNWPRHIKRNNDGTVEEGKEGRLKMLKSRRHSADQSGMSLP